MKSIEEKTAKVVALYGRVSTGRQENEATIESQLDEIRKKIEADGNILPDENVFIDDGWTGELLARPYLDKMRDAAAEGKFDVLYAYDRGRVSRVFFHQEVVINELMEKEVGFVSLHDINPTTPDEKFLQSVQGLFHEYEKVKIAERFRRGKLYKARSGVMINGGALYGYTYIKKADDKTPARVEINDDEADVVKRIFRWVGEEGLSIRGVIKKLYRMGIYPRKRKKDSWSKGTITRLLSCKTYFDGIAYYNKSEAVVAKHPLKNIKYKKVKRTSRRVRPFEDWIPFDRIPKLFDDMFLYDRVQKILEDNKKYASKNRVYDYLLTGKTFCEHGFRRVGDGYSKGSNHYYRSAARIYEFPKETECDCRGVNAVVLDKIFWDKFEEILTDPALMKNKAEKWLKHKDEYPNLAIKELAEVNKKIEGLREEGTRYAKMRGASQIDSGQFEDLMKDIRGRKKKYLEEIEEIKSKANSNQNNNISLDELCQEAQSVIKSLGINDKKHIVRELVQKVVIMKGGDEVETWIKIPLNQAHHMGYEPISWYCRFAKCWEKHAV